MGYKVVTTKGFDKNFDKFTKKDKKLGEKIIGILEQLESDPFYSGLKTHKVMSRNYGIAYSSRVTSDLRIIWNFKDRMPVILALAIGGHSGGKGVYK